MSDFTSLLVIALEFHDTTGHRQVLCEAHRAACDEAVEAQMTALSAEFEPGSTWLTFLVSAGT